MKKFEKDLALIYENKVLNEGLPPGTGAAIRRLWRNERPGVIGFFHRWGALRSLKDFQQDYKFLQKSQSEIEVALGNVVKQAPAKRAAAMQGTLDNIINNPIFKELELDPGIVRDVPWQKSTQLLSEHFAPSLDVMRTSLAQYTKLPESTIGKLILIPSETRAQELFKRYLPLVPNINQTIKSTFINALKIYGFTVLITTTYQLAMAVEATARAAQATGRAIEQAANLGEGSLDRLANFFGIMDNMVRQNSGATPPQGGGTAPPQGGDSNMGAR